MKQKVSILFLILAIVFNICLITANLLETKLINVLGLHITAGMLVFPISYIINDCITEVWGFKKARLVIWFAFLMNIFVAVMGKIASLIPPAPYWDGAEHFNYVFDFLPRITIASLIAFLIGSFLNSYVMSKMKQKSKGKRFSIRAIVSTVVGELADSVIFFPIAFFGIIENKDLIFLMCLQIILKTSYEIIVLPITNIVVKQIKKHENTDVYDEDISYNVFKIKDL